MDREVDRTAIAGRHRRRRGRALAQAVRRIGQDRLHVAPTKVRIRLQHQGNDTRDHRRGRRGAAERVGIVPVAIALIVVQVAFAVRLVRGGDPTVRIGAAAAGRRRDKHVGAAVRVPRGIAVLVMSRNRDRVARRIQVIALGIVPVIAGRLDNDRTTPAAPSLDRRLECGICGQNRGVGLVVEIRRGAPTVVDDIEGIGLADRFGEAIDGSSIEVGVDVRRAAKDVDARQHRAPGNADAAHGIVRARDHARDRGAVLGGRVNGRPRIEHLAAHGDMLARVVIGGQVLVGVFDAVVVDADRDGGSDEVLPDRLEIADHGQVPLAGIEGIVVGIGIAAWRWWRRCLVGPIDRDGHRLGRGTVG